MESSLQYFFKENVFLCSHLLANSSDLELGTTKMKNIMFTGHVYTILMVSKQPSPFQPKVLIYHTGTFAVVDVLLYISLAEIHL